MRDGITYPAMPMESGMPNYFTINGRAYPSTDTIHMKVGETVKVRFIGSNSGFIHPMHIHGGPFEVVARDGETLAPAARFRADTLHIGPGQRYDVIWKAPNPGKWMLPCHKIARASCRERVCQSLWISGGSVYVNLTRPSRTYPSRTDMQDRH